MENTGYVALSLATGLQNKMELIANNIANVNTNGFKSSNMKFKEYVFDASNQKSLSMVEDYGNYRNFSPGSIESTGNPLDVALIGNGFMAVMTPTGEKYTRNGAMQLDTKGQLVSSAGDVIADTGGKPITIPAGATDISIIQDGTVSADGQAVGRLKVVKFEDPQQLSPVGNSLFTTTQTGTPDDATSITQGAVEGSNVNSVIEMTNMIEVMRKYESVARILQTEHDSQTSMIQRIAKI